MTNSKNGITMSTTEHEQTLFKEVKANIHKSTNSNFHFNSLDGAIKLWIIEICYVAEQRIKDIESKLKDTDYV